MTKQEEIRKGISGKIEAETVGGYLEHWDEYRSQLTDEQQRDYFLCCADEVLEYLDSVGVVIKVDGDMPEWLKLKWAKNPACTSQDDIDGQFAFDIIEDAGYALIAPLIKDKVLAVIDSADIEEPLGLGGLDNGRGLFL